MKYFNGNSLKVKFKNQEKFKEQLSTCKQVFNSLLKL